MQDIKHVMTNVYNKVYLYIHEHFDPEIAEKRLLIDNHARNIFKTLNSTASSAEMRSVKVKIIKAYENLSNISDPDARFFTAVAKTKQNLKMKITVEENSKLEFAGSLKLIPQTKLDLRQKNELFDIKRAVYFKKVNDEDPEKSKKLQEFLKMPEMRELARQIDSDMRQGLTLQNFAELIGSKYPDKIKDICTAHNQNSAKKIELGADDITDACLAMLLLQKGGDFPLIVEQFINFCVRNDHLNQGSDASLGSIEASAQPFILAISLIDEDAAARFNSL